MVQNPFGSLMTESIFHFDDQKRLNETPALLGCLYVIRKTESALSDGLFECLLILCSKWKLPAYHLKDQTAKWPIIYLIGIVLAIEDFGSNVIKSPANRFCILRD